MGLLFAGAVSDNAPLWFLISLFVVRVVFAWLKKRSINTWMIIFGSLTLSYALSFIPAFKPYYLANIFLGLFFFSIGNKLQKTPAVSDNDYLVLLILPIALLYLIRTSFVDFRTNTLMEGNYLIYCLMSLLAILGWNKLFKKLEYSKPRGGYFCNIGANSLFYYCTHWIILRILVEVFKPFMSGTLLFVLCFVSLLIILFVLEHSFKNKYDRFF